ncbi:MAG: SIS domain-containing protein [Gammaproteobacteria bacterium]|nr:SIS domain-containing protein [Gammaproteobacteria bacterium]
MSIFELDYEARQARGAAATTQEILQQPRLWGELAARHSPGQGDLHAFLAPLLARPDLRILLTGAGTSAFIGECLRAPLAQCTGRRAEAVATTDLVAAPKAFLETDTPTLLVSFARSGDSPESVATFDLAQRGVRDCAQLIVTCNPKGALLARARADARSFAIVLPAANDRAFAMTSSFTAMLLATALAFELVEPEDVRGLARLGPAVMGAWEPRLSAMVESGFQRAVFLGSNVLKALAREAALKLLELTDGRVVAIGESPLGFRHGPKTILDGSTLVVMLLSSDAHTRRYDLDLLAELRREALAGTVLAVSSTAGEGAEAELIVPVGARGVRGDLLLCLPYAMLAQSLALLRSLSLGLAPDSPHAAGTVSRVVQGVTIHPFDSR